MKKRLLVCLMLLSILALGVTGCGGKTESSKESVNSEEAESISDMPEKEPQKCKNHNAEIAIPGEYNLTVDSTDDNLVYANADGSKAIGFSYAPNLKIDSTSSIPWDNVVSNFSNDISIDTYEEISVTDLPGIKFFFSRDDGLSGEMAMIIDPNGSCGYIIQMLQGGEFDDESTFDEILNSFHIIQEVVNENEESKTEATVKEPMTDMEFLTFEDHPKLLDDYEDAFLKWNKDKRLCVKEGVWADWESYGDNPFLYVECRGDSYISYNELKLNEVQEIKICFEKCTDDAASLSLEEAMPLIKSYIPIKMLKDKCSIDFAVKWTDEDTDEKKYKIAYINEEYDSSELIQRDPREISVLVVTNEDDIVKRVEIGENAWKSYLGHEYEEWDYDLFEDY